MPEHKDLSALFTVGESTDVSAQPEGDQPRATLRKLTWLLSILAALSILAVALVPLVRFSLYPPTEKGACLIFYPSNCISLSPSELESVFSLRLPANAQIIESGSNRTLKTGAEYALLAVHPEQVTKLLAGYETGGSPVPSGRTPDYEGLTFNTVLVQKGGDTVAYLGSNVNGDPHVFFVRTWDG